ncbi:MAG: nuclease A inhibitor family protein [Pyrinomonadaceae bacterium]
MKKKKFGFEEAIRRACDGLQFPSETEAEIVPFMGGKVVGTTREALLKEITPVEKKKIEERPFIEFFTKLSGTREWFTPADTERSNRFIQLQKVLEESLEDLIVLRVGRIQIDIYIVGRDRGGNMAGVTTRAVET